MGPSAADALKENWSHGRHNRLSIPAHGFNVVTCLQIDAESIITSSDDATITIHNIATGKLIHTLKGHKKGIWCMKLVGNILVSGSTDMTVRVWDVRRGICIRELHGFKSTVRTVSVLLPELNVRTGDLEPDEPLIVAGSRDATLRIWRLPAVDDAEPIVKSESSRKRKKVLASPFQEQVEDPLLRHVLRGHANSVRAVAAHGNTVVSGSYDRTVRIWNAADGKLVHTCTGHAEKVYSVAHIPELEKAVSGSMDAIIKVWCTRTGNLLFDLEGHTSLVGLLKASSEYIVSAAADATLRVWDSASCECIAELVGHTAAITAFHYRPSARTLVSGSEGGVRLWDLDRLDLEDAGHLVQPKFLEDCQGVWRVWSDEHRLVAIVQREGGATSIEVLDFAESDGYGRRTNLPAEVPDDGDVSSWFYFVGF
ncbi:SCF ubiquitin ligase complex subunit cdc4 [Thoreauomyces humboldtii]|nr:SCF ubiquitin ligase complex subunit cdc4 [Thoreauomyces humboldtii]